MLLKFLFLKLENLAEIEKFLDTGKLPKLIGTTLKCPQEIGLEQSLSTTGSGLEQSSTTGGRIGAVAVNHRQWTGTLLVHHREKPTGKCICC